MENSITKETVSDLEQAQKNIEHKLARYFNRVNEYKKELEKAGEALKGATPKEISSINQSMNSIHSELSDMQKRVKVLIKQLENIKSKIFKAKSALAFANSRYIDNLPSNYLFPEIFQHEFALDLSRLKIDLNILFCPGSDFLIELGFNNSNWTESSNKTKLELDKMLNRLRDKLKNPDEILPVRFLAFDTTNPQDVLEDLEKRILRALNFQELALLYKIEGFDKLSGIFLPALGSRFTDPTNNGNWKFPTFFKNTCEIYSPSMPKPFLVAVTPR